MQPYPWGTVRKERKSNCLSVCLCVCVNEIPVLIFYMRMLSDVSSLIWMPLMDGRHYWMALMDGINGHHYWMALMEGINGRH